MPHATYTTNDFLADESFQAFVAASDPAAVAFWQSWIAQHPAQAAAFHEAAAVLRLLATSRAAPAPASLKQAEIAKLWHAMEPVGAPAARPLLRSHRAARSRWWAATALAAVVILVVAGLGFWPRPAAAPAWARYATAAGQHRQVVLPDGSRVVLNGSSELRLAATWQPGQAREVWLTGEAYFDVQHTAPAALMAVARAPARVKFTVHAGALDVAVLGTRFDVLSRAGTTKVVLNSGQIELRRTAGPPEPLLMQPGDLVEFDATAPRGALAKRAVQPAFYSAWTSGHLDFNDTPVAEIIALLEDTYGLQITLGNPALRRQKLTGSVPNRDVDVLLDALGKSLDVKVHRVGNRVKLD
ncbi:FecR family protein [Hymenobacter nivis]|nr:FecR domain-containing protein [Hymenobacter nivis]